MGGDLLKLFVTLKKIKSHCLMPTPTQLKIDIVTWPRRKQDQDFQSKVCAISTTTGTLIILKKKLIIIYEYIGSFESFA